MAVPTRVLGPFLVARAPSFAVRNGKPLVDTGRSIRCAGAPSVSCQLSVTARPSGASARLRGRPAIAGATHVPVAGGVQKKVTLSLNPRAYRPLRAHGRHPRGPRQALRRRAPRQRPEGRAAGGDARKGA